ncbi:VanW family protein [Alicyclobacillus ferrooxydans]|uniref:VanW family protein n=1 Tax=Alicyclobacillus ferrooxydans TaxID=471514 RepID=UPI0006D546AA|nr:VanW family protein [Alicyclobacillus ferrooxydans]
MLSTFCSIAVCGAVAFVNTPIAADGHQKTDTRPVSSAGSVSAATLTKFTAQPLVLAASQVSMASKPIAAASEEDDSGKSGSASTTKQIPINLYMPPNPPAPGKDQAAQHKLQYMLAQRSTNYRHASPTQAKNIELVAKRLNGTVIQPGQTFSYNQKLGPYTEQNGYGWGRAFSGNRIVPSLGGGVCQGASTLYSTLIRTGAVTFVERHAHSLTVPYLPGGEDATVSYSSRLDFRFKNTSDSPIMIGAQGYPEKRVITVAIWSAKPNPQITVHHKVLAVYPFQTVTTSSSSDEEKVVAPGQVGGKVATWLEIKTDKGVVTKSLGTDTYKPSPRIIEK